MTKTGLLQNYDLKMAGFFKLNSGHLGEEKKIIEETNQTLI